MDLILIGNEIVIGFVLTVIYIVILIASMYISESISGGNK